MDHGKRTTRRLGASLGLTAFALGLAATAAAPAQAASGNIPYQCAIVAPHGDYDSDGNYLGPSEPLSEPHPMTATFDSPLEDGAEVPVGTRVRVSPIESTYTLSPALVDELLAYAGGKMAEGTVNLRMTGYVGNARLKSETMLTGLPYALKAGSSLSLTGSGKAVNGTPESFEVREGPHDFLAHDVFASLDNGDSLYAFLSCTPDRNARTLIDLVTGVDSDTALPSPTPSRPSVVQTDAAQPESPSWLPLAAVGAGSFILVGGLTLTRRQAARH